MVREQVGGDVGLFVVQVQSATVTGNAVPGSPKQPALAAIARAPHLAPTIAWRAGGAAA